MSNSPANSTSNTEIVKAFMQALEKRNFDSAASYLADDFIYGGATPQPLNRDQFITLVSELVKGVPSLTFHTQDVQQQGETVTATIQMTGAQVETFLLVPLGMPPVPQMGRSFSLPREHVTYAFKGDRIATMTVQRVPGGGIPGMLQQLGIDLPLAQ